MMYLKNSLSITKNKYIEEKNTKPIKPKQKPNKKGPTFFFTHF